MPDFIKVLSNEQTQVDESMEIEKDYKQDSSLHVAPLQDGSSFPSLASVNSGFVTHSTICSHFVLGKLIPKV